MVTQLAIPLLGSWRLISWTYEVLATGKRDDALGKDPRGYIHYLPDGRMMVLVLKADRRKPASLLPTPDERIALYDTMFAYAGRYTVDGDRVTHHIDMSWNAAWEGTEQIRYLKFEDGKLIYKTMPTVSPLDGREGVHTVTFAKLE